MFRDADSTRHLDGLRGLAALVVVIHHFACAFFPALVFGTGAPVHSRIEPLVYASPLYLLAAGNFAVCMFFILSGFVLTHAFFITGQSRLLVSGAIRRYLRLTLPITAAVAFAYVLIRAGQYQMPRLAPISGSPWAVAGWAGPTGWWDAVKVTTYDSLFTGQNVSGFMNVLWTMNIEFYGSLLVFAVALVIGKLRRRWLLYTILVVFFLKTYYLAFIIGMALADLHSTRPDALKMSKIIAALALVGGLLLGATQIPGINASYVYDHLARWGLNPTTTFVLSHVLGAGLIFLSLFSFPSLRAFFSRVPMRYLGQISFFIYLLHLPILASFGVYAFLQFYPTLGYVRGSLVSLTLTLPIIFILADIFTRLVDDPAVRFSKYAYRQIFESQRAPIAK